MGLRRNATETLQGVKTASASVIETTSWATVALIAVAAAALLALLLASISLGRTR